jgi:ABC-type lipoprotein export system ATPase subunit
MFITLKNATKKYGEGESLIYALNGLDLQIGESEICVILGSSGSGKSTLLTSLSYFGSLLFLRRKVSKINMVESLKGNRE